MNQLKRDYKNFHITGIAEEIGYTKIYLTDSTKRSTITCDSVLRSHFHILPLNIWSIEIYSCNSKVEDVADHWGLSSLFSMDEETIYQDTLYKIQQGELVFVAINSFWDCDHKIICERVVEELL